MIYVLKFQQTINAAGIFSFEQNSNNELRRFPAARRLRAPLMGRSIKTTLNDDDDKNLIENQSNDINNNDENKSININKRRYGITLLGRRKWMALKRRGPLFG